MRSIHKRILSSLVLAPIVIMDVYYGGWAFYVLMAGVFLISVQEWSRLSRYNNKFEWPVFAAGVVYVGAACAAAVFLRMYETAGLYLLLYVLFAIWACDSGAYIAGKMIGGPKMAPSISPNKTWAGLIGGAVSAAFVVTFFAYITGDAKVDCENCLFIQSMFWPIHLIVGALLAVLGQAGDLLISKLKRRVGLKDTGNIIPGHGGLLDRIDALLLVLPIFALIVAVLEAL